MSRTNEMAAAQPKQQIQQKPKFSVAITTEGYQKLVRNTLRDPDRCNRFIASITSAVAVNPALQECDAGTILGGALLGESLGLSPSPQLGQYYLVPFKQKEKKDRYGNVISPEMMKATFVLGYKGFLQMALRSGAYSDIDVLEIREGEYLGRDKTTGKHTFSFHEDDDIRETLPVIGYMAFFEYTNGFKKTIYWSKKKMVTHADKYSPAFSASAFEKLQNKEIPDSELWKYSSFWYKDFDEMAKKTMIRQLISKWGIMSTELMRAMDSDGSLSEISNGKIITTPESDIPVEEPNIFAEAQPTNEAEPIDIDKL